MYILIVKKNYPSHRIMPGYRLVKTMPVAYFFYGGHNIHLVRELRRQNDLGTAVTEEVRLGLCDGWTALASWRNHNQVAATSIWNHDRRCEEGVEAAPIWNQASTFYFRCF
jgi:hypothetical protein